MWGKHYYRFGNDKCAQRFKCKDCNRTFAEYTGTWQDGFHKKKHTNLKKFSQNPAPEALHKYLASNYPGANYYSVYEAGFCGFWIHEKLTDLGINNIVSILLMSRP